MKKSLILCMLLIYPYAVVGCHGSIAQHQSRQQEVTSNKGASLPAPSKENNKSNRSDWRAATFRGLTVGQSTQEQMFEAFGKPARSDIAAGQQGSDSRPLIWNEYDEAGEFPGKLTVEVDKHTGVIAGMIFSPENITKDVALKHFGDDYIITRYEFDICSGDEEDEPSLYESPNGQFTYVEYRSRGIAISLDAENKVREILYLKENDSIGAKSSKCPEKKGAN